MIIPAVLIGTGVMISNSRFEKKFQDKVRNMTGDSFNPGIDDYLRSVPVAEMYIADLAGLKSRNHWFDQTKYLLISNILTTGITSRLKRWTSKTRPDGDARSFPSGHATFAFTNATVLYNEFRDSEPLLAYSGFVVAGATASLRVMKNKHWLSDVLAGAGIGIGITDLVYYFHPLQQFNPFKKEKGMVLVPQVGNGNLGFYFSCVF